MSSSAIPTHSASHAKARLGAVTGHGQAQGSHLRLVSASELQCAVDLAPSRPVSPSTPVAHVPTLRERATQKLAQWRPRLNRLTVIKNVAVGVMLEVMEGFREFLAPAAFCVRNFPTIGMGVLTVTVPVMIATALWLRVPGWAEGFPVTSPLTWAFLAGLSVAVGFLAAMSVVTLRALLTGIQMAVRHLRRKGQTAFE